MHTNIQIYVILAKEVDAIKQEIYKMVIDIKMCRFENVPWGFRLVGGADFEFPLTVVKVSTGRDSENFQHFYVENSIYHQCFVHSDTGV